MDMAGIAPDEAHVHFPTNALDLDPEAQGIKCGICLVPLDMNERQWQDWFKFWVFDRFKE